MASRRSRILERATPQNPLQGGGEENIVDYNEILKASVDALAVARAKLTSDNLKAKIASDAPPPTEDDVNSLFAIPFDRASEYLLGSWQRLCPEPGGHCRLPDGGLFVSCTTHMPQVSGNMLKWWFTWCDKGYKYKLWHPEDHIWCTWDTRQGETLQDEAVLDARLVGYEVGRTHVVTEHLGKAFGRRAEDLHIQFMNPSDFGFASEVCEAAGIAFVCCCRTCVDNELGVGMAAVGRMIHIARDHQHGLELKSFFWLGLDAAKLPDPSGSVFPPKWLFDWLANTRLMRRVMLKELQGEALLRHAFEEFNTLGAVLPRLFQQEASNIWKTLSARTSNWIPRSRL